MADFDIPVATGNSPTGALIRVDYRAFSRATGEDLRTPVENERQERLRKGLAALDNDFPGWLEEASDDGDAILLRFRDLEAVGNVASKLRDRGLVGKTDRETTRR